MKSNTNQKNYKQDTTCEYIAHNEALSATLLHHYHQPQILITITVKEHRVLLKIPHATLTAFSSCCLLESETGASRSSVSNSYFPQAATIINSMPLRKFDI